MSSINRAALERQIKIGLETKIQSFLTKEEYAQITIEVTDMIPNFKGPDDIIKKILEELG